MVSIKEFGKPALNCLEHAAPPGFVARRFNTDYVTLPVAQAGCADSPLSLLLPRLSPHPPQRLLRQPCSRVGWKSGTLLNALSPRFPVSFGYTCRCCHGRSKEAPSIADVPR